MGKLIEMLKELHERSVKMRWLKMINKENDKYSKLYKKLQRQSLVIGELVKEYEKEFGEVLGKGGD